MRRGLRRFWRCYFAAVGLYMASSVAIAFGPAVEAHFLPVRVQQSVDRIERAAGRLCWDWSGLKVRDLASDDLDVYLYVGANPDRLVTSVYRADTGMPWSASGAPRPGPVTTRYCTTLPPAVRPTDTLRLAWRAWYPSGTRLWRFAMDLPAVTSEGAQP